LLVKQAGHLLALDHLLGELLFDFEKGVVGVEHSQEVLLRELLTLKHFLHQGFVLWIVGILCCLVLSFRFLMLGLF